MDTKTIQFHIPEHIKTALYMLENAGYEAYLVGGCVRDTLLGHTPEDFDITTNALPAQTLALFAPHYKVITTGEKHGTITPIIDHVPVEITTYRIDGDYTDNRHPDTVAFSADIRDDLARRDFTVNALAYSEKSGLVDAFDAVEDLRNGIIRCVGTADARFGEDALRMMRALRFSAVLCFTVESDTAQSIRKNFQNVLAVSAERIYTELKKLLAGTDAARVLREFPCLCETLFQITLTESKLTGVEAVDTVPLRLALLFVGEDVTKLRFLKPDNKTYRYVKRMNTLYTFALGEREKTVAGLARFMYENSITKAEMRDLLRMREALGDTAVSDFPLQTLVEKAVPTTVAELAIDGNAVTALGYTGRAVKRKLCLALEAVIDGKCENEERALCAYLMQ